MFRGMEYVYAVYQEKSISGRLSACVFPSRP